MMVRAAYAAAVLAALVWLSAAGLTVVANPSFGAAPGKGGPAQANAGGRLVEGVVRDQDGHPVVQAVVYLPEAGAAPRRGRMPRQAVMDQVARAFVPPALVVPVGTTVRFPNSDAIHHSVYSFSRVKRFELGLFKGQGGAVTFDRPGEVKIFCSIHKTMAGLIVVVEHPYAAVTDAQGRFAIRDVPEGGHAIRAVHIFSVGATGRVAVGQGAVRADLRLKMVPPAPPQQDSYS